MLLVTATRLASTTPRRHTHTGKHQDSHRPGSARPSPQPSPTPQWKRASTRTQQLRASSLSQRRHGWKVGPRQEVRNHVAASSGSPGLHLTQPTDLAALRAPKGAETEPWSCHQPTMTLAKLPRGLRLSHQKATQPETKEQLKKGEGGSHGSLATGQPRPAREDASHSGHYSSQAPGPRPSCPWAPGDPGTQTGPSLNPSGYPTQASGISKAGG